MRPVSMYDSNDTRVADKMAFSARTVTRTRRGLAWRAISWILLVAFALQSYATQTHIHATPHAGEAFTIQKVTATGTAPLENRAVDCPFCQAIVHSGMFFSPTPPILLLPAWAVHAVLVRPAFALRSSATAHSWQSRAPPQG